MRDLLERNHSSGTVIKDRLTPILPDLRNSSNDTSPPPLENHISPTVSFKPAPMLGRGLSTQLRNLDAESSSSGSFCGRGRGRFTATPVPSSPQPAASFSYRLRSMSSHRVSANSPTTATSPTLNSRSNRRVSSTSPQDVETLHSIPIIGSGKGSGMDSVAPSEASPSDGKRRPAFVLRRVPSKNHESIPTFFNYPYSNPFSTDHVGEFACDESEGIE